MRKKLTSLRSWYQIPNDLNPRFGVYGEWCSHPRFRVGIYEACLIGGLRLPLNPFAREILPRLGLGINQLNPNAWRLIISMQVLWRKVFDGNYPLTVDEFLYCYKPSKISQSLGFYQFSVKSSNCRLVKSLPTSNRKWKTEFCFVSVFWVGKPIEVGTYPFSPYIGEMGNLRPEGMSLFHYLFHFYFCTHLTIFFFKQL